MSSRRRCSRAANSVRHCAASAAPRQSTAWRCDAAAAGPRRARPPLGDVRALDPVRIAQAVGADRHVEVGEPGGDAQHQHGRGREPGPRRPGATPTTAAARRGPRGRRRLAASAGSRRCGSAPAARGASHSSQRLAHVAQRLELLAAEAAHGRGARRSSPAPRRRGLPVEHGDQQFLRRTRLLFDHGSTCGIPGRRPAGAAAPVARGATCFVHLAAQDDQRLVQTGLHRAEGTPQQVGDLLERQSLVLLQDDRRPLILGQRRSSPRATARLCTLRADQVLDRLGRPLFGRHLDDVDALRGLVDRSAALLPDPVTAEVQGDAVEPRRELRLALEPADRPEGPQKRLLADVARVLLAADRRGTPGRRSAAPSAARAG